jgi:hypothetical protein
MARMSGRQVAARHFWVQQRHPVQGRKREPETLTSLTNSKKEQVAASSRLSQTSWGKQVRFGWPDDEKRKKKNFVGSFIPFQGNRMSGTVGITLMLFF